MNKITSLLSCILVLAIFLAGCEDDAVSPGSDVEPDAEPVKILFLGSSLFSYNDLPGMFRELAESGGRDVLVDHYYISAGYLDDHAISGGTLAKINSDKWDFVVLQGVGAVMALPDTHHEVFPDLRYHGVEAALIALKQQIEANHASAKTVYAMPWAYEDGMTWFDGRPETYFDMQQMIYDNTLRFSEEIGFVVAPVGWAWNEVMKTVAVPHYLFRTDWNHPSVRGSYLMACAIYSTLFMEGTDGITYYAEIPEGEAESFQAVADSIVLNDLELWNR